MICSKCNSEIKDGSKFCTNCGESLPKTKKCVRCGADIKEETSFCVNCGAKQTVEEVKPKFEEVQQAEQPQPKVEKEQVKAEPDSKPTEKIPQEKPVSTVEEEQKKAIPKDENEQYCTGIPVKKKAQKNNNQWLSILLIVVFAFGRYFVKHSKSDSNIENIEHKSVIEDGTRNDGFQSESDIRHFLSEHVFINDYGYRVSFLNDANEMVVDAQTMASLLVVQSYDNNKAELCLKGKDKDYYLRLSIGNNGEAKIIDKFDNVPYKAYTLDEAVNISWVDIKENTSANEQSNYMSLSDFYNDYVFGNKEFSTIAKTTCTPRLLKQLKDAYEYDCESGDCYAMWLFRSGNQDGVSDECRVKEVTDEGGGWFKVSYIDMGIEGATYIRLIPYEGHELMDEIRRAN